MRNFRQELWNRIGYYGVICSLGSIICFMILYVLLQSQKAYRKERQHLLQSLGIPQSWSCIIQMSEVLAPAFLAGILSPLALSWFFTYEDNRRLALAGSSMILPFRLRLGIPAIWYAGVLLTVLAVSCGVAMADPDRGDGT